MLLYLGSLCVETSAPDASLRTINCDEENYFICDIDANLTFNFKAGIIILNYIKHIYRILSPPSKYFILENYISSPNHPYLYPNGHFEVKINIINIKNMF